MVPSEWINAPLDYLQTLGHAGKIFLALHTPRTTKTGPLYVQIGISNRCNYRCAMCWDHPEPSPTGSTYPDEAAQKYYQEHPEVDRNRALMDRTVFQTLVNNLYAMGTRRIKLIGRGEPLLHPACSEMVAYAKNRGMSCSLTTNGSLLTEELADRFVHVGLDAVEISLNAATEETYSSIHTGSKGMKKVLAGIRSLIHARAERGKKKPRLILSFAIHAMNWREIVQMVSLSAKLGADDVAFRQTLFYPAIGSLKLEPEEVTELAGNLKRAEGLVRSLGLRSNIRTFLPSVPRLGKAPRPDRAFDFPCYAGWYFSLILSDGTVSPCCQCMRTMGNLRSRPFPEIWGSAAYRRFREDARKIPDRGSSLEGCRCHDCALEPHNRAFHHAVFFFRPQNPLRFIRTVRRWM